MEDQGKPKKKSGPKPKPEGELKEREYISLEKDIVKKWGGWDKIKAKIYKLLGQD